MNEIVRMKFGSHVYGTNTPESDTDYKAVFIPNKRDILLQRCPKTSIQRNTKQNPNNKNTPEDVDLELFTLLGYMNLLKQGQTVALDMLFTPDKYIEFAPYVWGDLIKNRHRLIHKNISPFVGYCHKQAAKYGVKGSRIAAVKEVLKFLKSLDQDKKLNDFHSELTKLAVEMRDDKFNGATKRGEFRALVDIAMIKNPRGTPEPHLEVCGRKVNYHCRVKYATEVYQKVLDQYGHRARLAEKNEGVDWKALMHAVRVCNEAVELLNTGHITFPRPEKGLLLAIRKGEVDYKKVASFIEEGLGLVKEASNRSTLPDTIDTEWAEGFVLMAYEKAQ